MDGGKVGQVRRIRFIGKSNSTVFKIKNGELTARKCYFAGNCSCFHLNNTNAKLNIKWCVFKPNSWNTMEEVIYIYAGNMLLMEECFVKNIRKNSYNGVVLYTETTGSIIETVTIKGSDFQNCEGYDGAVFYFWRVRNIAISNCSFYHLKSRGYAAVLYLYGEPAPSGFNFHVEDVIMKDNNATERLGSQFCADEINPTPFNNANIKNVTYYPLGPDLVSDYRNGVYTDHTSLITSGDGVETLFTSLSDDVHTLGDFQEFDLLANYITLGDDDDNNDDDDKKGGLSAGAIAGIVCGVIFGLLALVGVIVLICCCCCRRSSSSKVPLNTIHPHQQSPPTVSYVSPAVDYAMPQPPPAASTNYPPPPQQLPSGPMYYPPPPSQSLTPANYPPPPPSGSDHHTSITYPPPPPSDDYPQFPAEDD